MRWGIIGAGRIAAKMALTLRGHPQAEIVAVGSRDASRARRFADRHGIANALGSYDELVDRPDVDVVYVATTNDLHHPTTLRCIEAGKAVLCEKPLALNQAQAAELVAAARDGGVPLIEALWMRFLPWMSRFDDVIATGEIGEVRHVSAEFGFVPGTDPHGRLSAPELGGGGLLDIGIYPLAFAHHVAGPPHSTAAKAVLSNGVDVHTSLVSAHRNDVLSTLTSCLVSELTNDAVVTGTDGSVRVHGWFHKGHRLSLERGGDTTAEIDASYPGTGFQYEVDEMHRCIDEGTVESTVHPHAASLELASWMDEIRRQIGVRYPADDEHTA